MSSEVGTQPSECGSALQIPAKVLQFVSRETQIQLRGRRNFDHWHCITKQLEPFGPKERGLLLQRQADDERDDQEWSRRHGPRPGGAIVLSISDRTAVAASGKPDGEGDERHHLSLRQRL